jgi:hypothetical protein
MGKSTETQWIELFHLVSSWHKWNTKVRLLSNKPPGLGFGLFGLFVSFDMKNFVDWLITTLSSFRFFDIKTGVFVLCIINLICNINLILYLMFCPSHHKKAVPLPFTITILLWGVITGCKFFTLSPCKHKLSFVSFKLQSVLSLNRPEKVGDFSTLPHNKFHDEFSTICSKISQSRMLMSPRASSNRLEIPLSSRCGSLRKWYW